jgi:hypothetical protein
MRLQSGEVSPIELAREKSFGVERYKKVSGEGSVFIFAWWELGHAGFGLRATSCVAARLRCCHRRKWQERQIDLLAF